MRIKIILLFIVFIIIFNKNIYAKYVMEYKSTIAIIQIDTILPKIELLDIKNVNEFYKQDINKTENVIIQIKVIENNIKEDNFQANNIIILQEDKQIEPKIEINKNIQTDSQIVYEINISELISIQKLKVKIPKGIIKDISGNENEEKVFEIN